MKLRRLEEKDLPSIIELYKQFWNETSNSKSMKKKLGELICNQKYILLCAEINDSVVGTIMGIICEELYGNCKPFMIMENFVVDGTYRGMGIGKALLKELEKIATCNECTQMLFITESNRQDAISFYEAMGYNSKTHIGFKKSLI